MWEVGSTAVFDEWFDALAEDEQDVIIAAVEHLRRTGPATGRPLVDTLKGSSVKNLKELRPPNVNGVVIRVAFAFDLESKAMLLCAGDKAGKDSKKFYKGLISRAQTLFAEHDQALRAARKTSRKGGR